MFQIKKTMSGVNSCKIPVSLVSIDIYERKMRGMQQL